MNPNENSLIGNNGLAFNLLGKGYNPRGIIKIPNTQPDFGSSYNELMGVNQPQNTESTNPVELKSSHIFLDNNTGNQSWGDTLKDWFAPQGTSGASTAGNVLSGIGTAVGIGSGLAGMYYASKKAKLDKERAGMEKDVYNRSVQRDSENEARMQQLAKNAGNNAFYKL